jgi:glc operon protein GlcG
MASRVLRRRICAKQLTPAPVLCHFQSPRIVEDCRMTDFVTTHRLTHKASLKMIEAGIAKAEALGCKVSVAVADQSCRIIAFVMMDGARHFSIITTQRKAITAASQRLPTGYAPEENALSMSVRIGDFTNVLGGFPIEVNGEVIGAVAAGGAKIEQDVEVAKAALAALGLRGLAEGVTHQSGEELVD